ncbi:MAG: Holliday junction resolvase RuvX [Dehalococcoidia bacterium]|nr:Holliday junction resolvase RuvX [Dehalococcoidia bacterium]
MPARGRILAIDPGERRIGVAGADLGLRVAIPLTTIEGGPDAVEAVARLAEEEGARALVVGLPLSLSGALGPQAQRAQALAEALADRLSIPVLTWDERLTSAEARRRLSSGGGGRRDKRDVDALAAAIILQAYLDSQRPVGRPSGRQPAPG